jgi:hypothetical protein
MQKMEKLAFELVGSRLISDQMKQAVSSMVHLQEKVNEAKGEIAAGKTWKQRMFSYKALHGMLMVVSGIAYFVETIRPFCEKEHFFIAIVCFFGFDLNCMLCYVNLTI